MSVGNYKYSNDYKERLFYQWWKSGKPTSGRFILEVPPQEDGKLPNQLTIQKWIREEWTERAIPLDNQIKENFEADLVAEKIHMYTEQAAQASDLRIKAFNWLKENIDQLTPSTAIRLWIECINIEHTVSGIPEALEKMLEMSDEELTEATQQFLIESTADEFAT